MPIDDLVARLEQRGEHERYPPATSAAVELSQRAVGRTLPPDYVAFVTGFSNGAYLFGIQEVACVGAEAVGGQIDPVFRAAAWLAEDAPQQVPLDTGDPVSKDDLVGFSLDSNGNGWCFVIAAEADAAYVAYYAADLRQLFGRLDSFELWLARLMEHEDEVIRTLYGDDVLYDVLGLG